jgi:hypothetical protein
MIRVVPNVGCSQIRHCDGHVHLVIKTQEMSDFVRGIGTTGSGQYVLSSDDDVTYFAP